MLRKIWIPERLYRWIPRSAMCVGLAGIALLPASVIWTPITIITAGYGACVLAARACA